MKDMQELVDDQDPDLGTGEGRGSLSLERDR